MTKNFTSSNVATQKTAIKNALLNVAQAMTFVSGPTYGQITQIPAPRIVRLGVQYSF